MKYQIKNRFTMEVIFEHEAESLKIAVEFAIKSGANLYGANLSGADLRSANLYGEKVTKCPIVICAGTKWWICITEKHIQIGCQTFTAVDWFKLDDDTISKMASDALPWWKENKKIIKVLWMQHKKGTVMK